MNFCGHCGWCLETVCHRSAGRCTCNGLLQRIRLPAGPIVAGLRQDELWSYSASDQVSLGELLKAGADAMVELLDRFWWLAPVIMGLLTILGTAS